MKKFGLIVILLFATISLLNSALASPNFNATEALADDWSSRFADSTYWSDSYKWLDDPRKPHATVPSEKQIQQTDALLSAIKAIIQLGLETPESLSQYYDVELGFYFFNDSFEYAGLLYGWDIDLYRDQKHIYTIRINADSGRFFSINIFDSSYMEKPRIRQNTSVEALLDHWDKLYSDSPNYSPEVYGGEMLYYPLPENGDMTQRDALHYAAQLVLALSNHDVDLLYSYRPDVSFDVSPAACRWYLTIFQDSGDTEAFETFSFTINAADGTLEKLTWGDIHHD